MSINAIRTSVNFRNRKIDCFLYMREISPNPEKVVNFSFIINRASLSVLKTRLVAVQIKN
ncbi:hypothetical protein CEN43_04985 [Fischerella thermalis BR2B]|nr:hypothetical protein CBP29_00080 [Fischerella thermalis WC341]PMB03238.1 hypothetical protein CI592_15060 [Fischerella thermalis CCMEE 5328]PMB32672.1 hypothetical protein CEN42_13045 [Fischerella thermalis CCMEE 5208]PMB35431.1 hypothetical protein CEN43_04985 [Fischerella thermalis BR2B]RDH51869.1 hypothetical protein CBF18_05000 [Mastigocladus laminosus WC112]